MTYEEQHAALVADLKGKLHRQDWHGVSDAANDLRVLEAQHAAQTRVELAAASSPITLLSEEELTRIATQIRSDTKRPGTV